MKKISFLKKLFENKTIKIVETSEEIFNSYNLKSKNSLKSAKILRDNDQNEDSISLSYYSMYYKSLSLLFKCGIKCENHSATIIILKELFKLDNSKISYAKEERIDKQYYITDISLEETTELIKLSEEFNFEIEEFSERLTSKEITKLKKEFEVMLNEN